MYENDDVERVFEMVDRFEEQLEDQKHSEFLTDMGNHLLRIRRLEHYDAGVWETQRPFGMLHVYDGEEYWGPNGLR